MKHVWRSGDICEWQLTAVLVLTHLIHLRIKEAGKGYFHDMNMTRRNGGKTWIAPKVLIREDVSALFLYNIPQLNVMCQKALFLPNIVGRSLDDGTKKDTTTMCFGRITVLAMLGTQISEVVVNL